MFKGELQQFDTPANVYSRPANLFVAGFMGSPPMNFLDCATCETGVRLKNGTELAMRVPDGAPKKVVVGVRPEHIYLADAETLARRPNAALTEAVVEVVEPTGAETIVIMRMDDKEITSRFAPDMAPDPGETIKLALDMEQACLFDPKTEKLL